MESQDQDGAVGRNQVLGERLSEVIRAAAKIVIDNQFRMRMFRDGAANALHAVRRDTRLSSEVTPRRRNQIEESARTDELPGTASETRIRLDAQRASLFAGLAVRSRDCAVGRQYRARTVSEARLQRHRHDLRAPCVTEEVIAAHERARIVRDRAGDVGALRTVNNVESLISTVDEPEDGLVSLFSERDIQLWRRRWLSFLLKADEIVFFSNSSKELLLRAYPQLARHPALKLRPHDISDFPSVPVQFDLKAKLNIGIVGRINAHKGAAIVEQMATALDTRAMKEQITVFGALDGRRKSPSVVVTGSYQRDSLAGLMTKHNVNIIAFTSIWPETFSFVVAEVMSLGLPIICFDLGAPAERVKDYRLGRVIPFGDGATLVEAALAFRNELLEKATKPGKKVMPIVQSASATEQVA